MALFSLQRQLLALECSPDNDDLIEALKRHVVHVRAGSERLMRLLEAARAKHVQRSQFRAAAALIELEASLSQDDQDFVRALRKERARIFAEELFDFSEAIAAFDALSLDLPKKDPIHKQRARLFSDLQNISESVERDLEQARATDDVQAFLRAACLCWRSSQPQLKAQAGDIFVEALRESINHARAAHTYAGVLVQQNRSGEALDILRTTARHCSDRRDKIGLALHAAFVARDSLRDEAKAHEIFEEVLRLEPNNWPATAALGSYYAEHASFDVARSHYERALRTQKEVAVQGEILAALGDLLERHQLPEESGEMFARLRKLDPAHPRALLYARALAATEPLKLRQALEEALGFADDPDTKKSLALELARIAEQQNDEERAIRAWQEVARIHPGHGDAQMALNRLLKQTGHWNAVVDRIRERLKLLPASAIDEQVQGWLELARVYRDELKLPALAGESYEEVLKLRPADVEALETVQDLYRGAGRWSELITVLQRQADAIGDVKEKVSLYEQIASLWEKQFSDTINAAKALEQIIEVEPTNTKARARLKSIYTQRRDWASLYRVLQLELNLVSDANEKRLTQEALAELCTDQLKKYDEAIALWSELAADKKSAPKAFEALERLAEQTQDSKLLSDALERRVELSRDKKEKRLLLERLISVYQSKPESREGLARTWKALLDLDPKNRNAKRELIAYFSENQRWDELESLFATSKDWSGYADALHMAAERSSNTQDKINLLLREARVAAESLQQEVRVRRCYESIAALDSNNVRAAEYLAPLYEKEANWLRYQQALKALGNNAEKTQGDPLELWRKERDLYAGSLRDVSQAYLYAAKIFAADPTDAKNAKILDNIVEQSAAYQEYAGVLQEVLKRSDLKQDLVIDLRRKLASVAGEQLGEKRLAAEQLEAISQQATLSNDELRRLSRYYEELGDSDKLARLLKARVQGETDEKSKKRLALRLASLHESQSDKSAEAFDTYWKSHQQEPQRIDYLQGIVRTAPGAGRWSELENALVLLSERVSDPQEKSQHLIQLGDLRRTQLKDAKGALQAYQANLEQAYSEDALASGLRELMKNDSTRREALSTLAQVYALQDDRKAFSELFDAEFGVALDSETRRGLWLERAKLLEEKFSDEQGAFNALKQGVAQDPSDIDLLEVFIETGRRFDRQDEVAAALRKVLSGKKLEQDVEVSLTLQLAQIYEEELGEIDEARPLYARVLKLEPLNSTAFEALKRYYTLSESWAEIDALYAERIEQTQSQETRVELLLQLAFLQEDLTGDQRAAAKTYQEIVDISITQHQATRALRALYRKLGNWSALVRLLESMLPHVSEHDQIAIRAELAELYIRELGKHREGVGHYEQMLLRNAQDPIALQGLEALVDDKKHGVMAANVLAPVYRREGAAQALARVLEAILQRSDDNPTRFSVALELADLYEHKLRDLDRAFDKVALAVGFTPTDQVLQDRFGLLSELTGRLEEQVSVLSAVSRELEPREQAALLWRIATVQEKNDSLSSNLEETYRKLLEFAQPGEAEWQRTSSALADYLRRTKRAKELGRVLEAQLEFSDQPIQIYRELSDLYERDLQRSDKAISALTRWREIDRNDQQVFVRLRGLIEQSRDWERLAALLLDEAHRLGTDAQASELRIMAARIFEQQLSDPNAALEIWRKVYTDVGLSEPVALALIDLNRKAGHWQELSQVLLEWSQKIADPAARVELRREAASIQREHLKDDVSALNLWTQVIADQPQHPEAIEALYDFARQESPTLQLPAARAVVQALISAKDWKRSVEVLDVLGSSDQIAERIDANRRNASIRFNELEQSKKALDLENEALRESLTQNNYAEVVEEFEQLARKAGKLARFVTDVQALAVQSDDVGQRLALNRRAAWVAQHEANNDELARDGYRAILQDDPESREALDALIALERKVGDPQDLVSALERKVSLLPDPTTRPALLFEIAQLKEQKLNDNFGAIDAFEQLLNVAPDPRALDELARLYHAEQSWENLASVYERQIQFLQPKPLARVFELAELYSEQIQDSHRAIDALTYVVGESSVEEQLVERLRALLSDESVATRAAEVLDPILTRRGQWPEAIELLRLRLAACDVVDDKVVLLRRIAEIQGRQLKQVQEAFESYGEAFLLNPRSEQDAKNLTEIAASLKQWDRLAAYFDRALHETDIDDQDMIRVARQAAELFEQRLSNFEKAATSYERVHRFDPSDEQVAERLQNLYERLGKWQDLAALCREQLNFAESQDTQIALLSRLAQITETHFEQRDDAINVCREILQLDVENAFANQSLLRLLRAQSRWDDLAELLSARLERTAPSDAWNDLASQLASVSDEHLHDRQRAVELYGKVLKRTPQHAQAREALEKLIVDEEHALAIAKILEPIYESQQDWKKQSEAIGVQIERLQDVDEKSRRLSDLARLSELKLRDQNAAFSAWGKAMVVAPEDTEIQAHVDRLAEVLLEWQAWVQVYESAAISCQSATRRAALILDIARAQDKRLGDPRIAIKSYRRALDEDPWLDQARIELEALLTLVGDWQELVDVLEHQLDYKNDSASRLQLLKRIGSTYEDFLGNVEQAIHAYERALIEDNQDLQTLEALDRLYTASNEETKLVDILHRLLSLDERGDKQDYAVRLAALHEALGENEQAIEVLQLHVPDATRFPRAARVLSVLLEREGRFDDLQQHLQKCITNLQDNVVKSDALGRLGLLYEQRHRDEAKARVYFEQALSQDANNNLALDGLLRLARGDASVSGGQSMIESLLAQQGRFDELVAIKSLHLSQSKDPQTKQNLREELATLEEQRGGLDAALDLRLELFDSNPEDPAKRAQIEALARATGRMQSLVARIQQAAERASDPDVAAQLFRWLAECSLADFADKERAIYGYSRSLAAYFNQPEVWRALEELLIITQRWPELEQLLEQRIEASKEQDQTVALETRLAGLRWQQLSDEAGALRVLERLLRRAPQHQPAIEVLDDVMRGAEFSDQSLQLLEEIVVSSGDWLRLARAYEERSAREREGARAHWLNKAAEIYDRKNEKLAAFSMRLRAFEDDPALPGVFAALCAESRSDDQRVALLQVIDNIESSRSLEPEQKVSIWLEAAQWSRTQPRGLAYTKKYLEKVLAVDPESEIANTALVEVCRELGDTEGAVMALWKWAEASAELEQRVELWTQAAQLAITDVKLRKLTTESYQKIVSLDPTQTSAIQALLALRRSEEKWPEVAQLLEMLAESTSEPSEKIAALSELATLLRRTVRKPERALHCLEQLRALQPDSPDVAFQLADIYEELGRYEDLVALLENQIVHEASDESRIALHLQVADVLNRKLKSSAKALVHYRAILALRSSHPVALEAVEKSLRAERRWEELTDFLTEQANQAERQGRIDDAISLLDRAAMTFKEQRKDRRAAMRVFQRVIELDPKQELALRHAAQLAEDLGETEIMSAALERLIPLVPGPESVSIAKRIAALGNTESAERALKLALHTSGGTQDARQALQAHYVTSGQDEALARMLEESLRTSMNQGQRAQTLLELARLYRDKLNQKLDAIRCLEQARSISPSDMTIMESLADLYVEQGGEAQAVPVLEAIVATFEGKRNKKVVPYLQRLATALRSNGRASEALGLLERAVKLDANNITILRDLGLVSYEQQEWEKAQKALRALLLQTIGANEGVSKADVYFYLGDIAARLGDTERAQSMLERALSEQADHKQARTRLAELRR